MLYLNLTKLDFYSKIMLLTKFFDDTNPIKRIKIPIVAKTVISRYAGNLEHFCIFVNFDCNFITHKANFGIEPNLSLSEREVLPIY